MLTCLMKGIYCMSTCQMFGERSSLLGTSWRRGRAVGSHAGDRGSIPGRDTFKSIKQVGSASLSLSVTVVSVTRPRR